MKVCLISRSFWPKTLGGAEYYMFKIFEYLKRYCVLLVTRDEVDVTDTTTIKVVKTPKIRFVSSLIFGIVAGLYVRKKVNFDVIHVNGYWGEVAPLFIDKFIITIHDVGFLEENDLISKIQGYLCKLNAMKASVIITPSYKTKWELTSVMKIDPNKIVVIPNGVDVNCKNTETTKITDVRLKEKLGIKNNTKTILVLSRVEPNKGIEYLVRALSIIKKEVPVKLFIVGSIKNKRYLVKLKKIIKELNLENDVIFTGRISEKEKWTYYLAADVYCQPSISSEGFGIPLLEAMSCGTPIVATDVFRKIEHVPEEFIVRKEDPFQLASKIKEILILDPKDYRKQCHKVRKIATKFSWKNMINKTVDVYKQFNNLNP